MSMKLPKYVRLHKTALRLDGSEYYRDAGRWSVEYKFIDGQLVSSSTCWDTEHISNTPLVEITEDEWRKDNDGYV